MPSGWILNILMTERVSFDSYRVHENIGLTIQKEGSLCNLNFKLAYHNLLHSVDNKGNRLIEGKAT